jgi:superfamily II DNA/RNA helicase
MPRTAEQYLHRAGRTGRAGRPGSVLTLGQRAEFFVLARIANALSIDVEMLE